jgi:hypothetical protein
MRRQVYLAAYAALSLGCAAAARGQASGRVQILEVPDGAVSTTAVLARAPLLVSYKGKLDSSRKIYVRVFRDTLKDLTQTYPNQTPNGQCVLYAHTSRFPVDHAGDGQLQIDDLVDFIANDRGNPKQVITLVFEEGEDTESGGPLRLSKGKKGVDAYFAHAQVMTLTAPPEITESWDEAAKQQQSTQQAESTPWWKFWAVPAVKAAPVTPPPPPPVAQPGPTPQKLSSYLLTHCETVTAAPFVPMKMASDGAALNPQALEPIGVRVLRECGE